mmetsp:Transcript_85997/g.199958  ORF Transcript_85997/g.199958 Transcript_85997/m.199958 type:complete len:213 (+) Transcript_85997:366-1004(+)
MMQKKPVGLGHGGCLLAPFVVQSNCRAERRPAAMRKTSSSGASVSTRSLGKQQRQPKQLQPWGSGSSSKHTRPSRPILSEPFIGRNPPSACTARTEASSHAARSKRTLKSPISGGAVTARETKYIVPSTKACVKLWAPCALSSVSTRGARSVQATYLETWPTKRGGSLKRPSEACSARHSSSTNGIGGLACLGPWCPLKLQLSTGAGCQPDR